MANTGNTQQQINYGASANDGQGDPLRTAFIKTDDNFDNVWLAGPVGSNITIGNNTIQSNNTNGNIILKPNGTGIVQANASIIPNADGVRDLGSSTQAWRRAYIDELLPTDLTVSGDAVIEGNLTVEGDTIQIGNITTDTLTIQLANTAANATAATGAGITVGALDNIATILYNSTANRWNVSVGMSAVGNISAPYFSGNGSLLTGIASSYGNANVVANLAALASNPVSTTGNVSAGNLLTGGVVSATGNISAGNINVANTVNITQDLFVKTGSFTGDATGDNSIYAGFPTFTILGTDVVAQFAGNTNTYTQFNFQNYNTGNQASGDYVITADNGNDTTHFLNIGLTGGNWNGTQPNSLNSRLLPNDGYMYVQDGNLAIGVKDGSSTSWIWRFDITGSVTADGNLIPSANGVYSLGNSTNYWANLWVANNTIYIGGVPLGMTAGNVLTVNGNAVLSNNSNTAVSTTGNITAGNIITGGLISATGNITGGNVNTGKITLTNGAVIRDTAGDAVAIGQQAGETSQGNYAVAMGFQAAITSQGTGAVAIGREAGNAQGAYAVAIGQEAGFAGQSSGAIAIGLEAGNNNQGGDSVAIGYRAGGENQGDNSVAIGVYAAANAQGQFAVAIGDNAGNNAQGTDAVAIGASAGLNTQGTGAVALGQGTGETSQGANAVALGKAAGQVNQGINSIAIGQSAGLTNQGNNSIILNATGSALDQTTANTFTVAPVRNDVANIGEVVFYNTTSKEITYGNVISVAGNITGGNILTGGLVSATGNVTGNYILGNGSQLTSINAVTVDITDTNGLTTVYYPTFVENRTTAQIARADVDLTYRTDDNLLTVGNVSVTGNVTGGNIVTAGSGGDITLTGGNITGAGNISATGNVTGGNILGNGASMTGVATQVTGSWTVITGTNNYSFTVPINNTYQLWVLGNIPNGIIVYNATVSVSNTNVPVIGQQFAWNYEGGGNILMFTSIPAQIVGTAGAISNAAPAVTNTNVFTFGINNTSGNTVTVNYGYTKIS
jgi:hypothetical protein